MPELATDTLTALVRQKLDCLNQLWRLSGQQNELIEGGDISQLLKVLAAKQRLLNNLQVTEQQLNPFRDDDPEQRTWRSQEDRQHCAAMIEACEQLLAKVMQHEQQCEGQLRHRRDEAAQRLQGAHVASQARDAYAQHPSSNPTGNLDISSES